VALGRPRIFPSDWFLKSAYVLGPKDSRSHRGRIPIDVDRGHFGGHIHAANYKENCHVRRLALNQTGKRGVVVVMRTRRATTLPLVLLTHTPVNWRAVRGNRRISNGE
jgi:hypothetical protein